MLRRDGQRQPHLYRCALAGRRGDFQISAHQGGALTNAQQAQAAAPVAMLLRGVKRFSIILNAQPQPVWLIGQQHFGVAGLGVPPGVGQRFLSNTEEDQFGFTRHGNRAAFDAQGAGQSALNCSLSQPVERGSQAKIIQHRGAQIAAGAAHAFQRAVGQFAQVFHPAGFIALGALRAARVGQGFQATRKGNQRLGGVVVQFTRQPPPFIFLRSKNQRGIIL